MEEEYNKSNDIFLQNIYTDKFCNNLKSMEDLYYAKKDNLTEHHYKNYY